MSGEKRSGGQVPRRYPVGRREDYKLVVTPCAEASPTRAR
jgi:hypothetical protein